DVVEAQVLALARNDLAKIAIGNSVIEVQTQVALTPGATVRLAVNNTPEGLRLTLLGTASDGSGAAANATSVSGQTEAAANGTTVATGNATTAQGSAAIATAGTATSNATSNTSVSASTLAPQAQALPQDPVVVAAAAVATAVQTSAARQGGLAPLLAD